MLLSANENKFLRECCWKLISDRRIRAHKTNGLFLELISINQFFM